jgi:hypothetical protein
VEGALYTALEAAGAIPGVGVVFSAAGNIMETAVNVAVASGKVSEQNFEVAESDLWGQLDQDFLSISTASGYNETAILTDFARLQEVSKLILSNGPDSLAWSPEATPEVEQAMTPGFEIQAMQMLLPARYWVFPVPQTTSSDPIGAITKNLNVPPAFDTLTVGLGSGVWNGYAIGTGGRLGVFNQEFPGEQAINNDVFGNGVYPILFFNNLNGWNFPLWWDNYNTPVPSATGCNQFIVSITNQTSDDLTLSFQYEHGGGLLGSGNPEDPPSRDLPPYATDVVGLLGDLGSGPDFNFCVSNGSPADCQAVNYAQFEVQQDLCSSEAGDIHYTQIANRLYQDTLLDTTGGSYANDVPGIARIAVYNSSANQ